MPADAASIDELIDRLTQGDTRVMGELFVRFRARLKRMIQLRIDRRLARRVDASDVIQEAYLEATTRLDEYLSKPSMPFYLWLRFITHQRLLILHRRHLGAAARDVAREVSLQRPALPGATSAALAAQLVGHRTSPSQAAVRAEMKRRVQEALDDMDAVDREVLALRHFEQLSNGEVAQVLDIDESAASKRYVRALARLKDILATMPGGLDGL
jgi:RNA polymerase sigma-70 factor (ECF subfamily)